MFGDSVIMCLACMSRCRTHDEVRVGGVSNAYPATFEEYVYCRSFLRVGDFLFPAGFCECDSQTGSTENAGLEIFTLNLMYRTPRTGRILDIGTT